MRESISGKAIPAAVSTGYNNYVKGAGSQTNNSNIPR
jgi:hypothetical protein